MHHTWKPDHAQYRGLRSIQGMYDYHTTHGFSDIAQHITIAPDGSIWSGRPWDATPGSAKGHNHRGIFMFETIGDFDAGRDILQGAQRDTVVMVIAVIQAQFGLPNSALRFHNEMSSKTCPGSALVKADVLREVAAFRQATGDDAGERGQDGDKRTPKRLDELLKGAGQDVSEDALSPEEDAEHPLEGDAAYESFMAGVARELQP